MASSHFRILLPVALAAVSGLLAGCASKTPDNYVKPVVKTIAVVSASDPRSVTFESKSTVGIFIPLAGLVAASNARARQEQLTATLKVGELTLGEKLTIQVVADLRQAGYQVEVLTDVKRPPDRPDNIDITAIKTQADAILQLQVTDAGIYSGLFSGSHVPRVSIYGLMYTKGGNERLYSGEVYYGAHAEKGKDWAVQADPKYTYTSAEDAMQKATEVRAVFVEGTLASGKRMAEQIIAAIK